MKKLFAIAAVVAVALTSCVKNEVITPDSEINFKAVNYKNTKANVHGPNDTNTYHADEHFGVFAFPSYNTTEQYMSNEKIYNHGTEWKAATPYYWLKNNATLTFAAYSPYVFEDAGIVTATYEKGIAITGYATNNDLTKQVDLMVSDLHTQASGVVNVPFKHTLSQIKFTVKPAEANYSLNSIVINSVTFTVAPTANYASTNGTFANSAWTDHSGEMVYDIVDTDYALELDHTNRQSFGVPVLIIPQDAVNIRVDYTITDIHGNVQTCYAIYEHEAGKAWAKNTIYNYHLAIGMNEITFTPEVVSWDSEDIVTGEWR